jgi:hypothetical protein
MTRSGPLLRLSKKDIRDGLDVLDFTPFYRSVPFGVFDPFHLSTTIEDHPTVAVAAEAIQVWKVPQDRYINLGSFSLFLPDHNCISVIAPSVQT